MKKATIALDYTSMDDLVMQNSKHLLDRCGVTDLTFIHVIPNYLNTSNLVLKSPTLSKRHDDKLVTSLILKNIAKYYGEQNGKYNYNCVLLEGSPYTQIINYIKNNPTDILVTGKKHKSKGSGVTSQRIAHHVACNVLFITEEIDSEFNKIAVPIDFSDNSVRALIYAISIADKNTQIQPIHVISHASYDHFLTAENISNYRDIYLSAAKSEYLKILTNFNIDQTKISEIIYLDDTANNVAGHLLEFLQIENTNLVIMGAKGHNALDSILYGSVAEKLVTNNDSFPTIIIR